MANVTRVGVTVRNGNVDKALSIFNKKVRSSGILNQYRKNQEFEKPSVTKRMKKKEAIYSQHLEDKKTLWNDLKLRGIKK